MLAAVRNATNIKVVFRMKDPIEAAELADMVLGYNLEMPVHVADQARVVGHRLVTLKSESVSEQKRGQQDADRYRRAKVTPKAMGGRKAPPKRRRGNRYGRRAKRPMSAEGASNASVRGTGAGASRSPTRDR